MFFTHWRWYRKLRTAVAIGKIADGVAAALGDEVTGLDPITQEPRNGAIYDDFGLRVYTSRSETEVWVENTDGQCDHVFSWHGGALLIYKPGAWEEVLAKINAEITRQRRAAVDVMIHDLMREEWRWAPCSIAPHREHGRRQHAS
jgi:hypothetical protein